MSVRLLNLRPVPEDEAEEIRQLLTEKGFDFYETPAGRWGISSPGLWLRDQDRLSEAKAALESYQQERCQRVRAEYEELRQSGLHRTWADVIFESPLRLIFYVLVIGFILYLSIIPFLGFGG
ncbi:MAG: hypothetical protein COC09_06425 [Gammaproteobacteria bacterium]|nr:MAG: hypothetical protein COC09_06425 [Gammaproteobacteria bacterium]